MVNTFSKNVPHPFKLILCSLFCCLLSVANARAALIDYAWDQGKKQLAKTAAKKYLPLVDVWETAYEGTQFIMDGLNMIDTVDNVKTGITRNQPWAVAHTEVFALGPETNSDTGATVAHAESSQGSWLGDAATSVSHATTAGEGYISINGASTGWASWLGMAGIGAYAKVGGTGLKKLAVKGLNQVLDPYASPRIDPNSPSALAQEKQLLEPAGFDYFARVYYPGSSADESGALYYEAEVFGFLELVDENAATAEQAIKPAVYAVADYFDPLGNVIRRDEGSLVTNLDAGDFTYFENTASLPGGAGLLNIFGYQLQNFELDFNVDIPSEWMTSYADDYVHVDFQAINGGVSSRVPEPGTFLLLLAGAIVLAATRLRAAYRLPPT